MNECAWSAGYKRHRIGRPGADSLKQARHVSWLRKIHPYLHGSGVTSFSLGTAAWLARPASVSSSQEAGATCARDCCRRAEWVHVGTLNVGHPRWTTGMKVKRTSVGPEATWRGHGSRTGRRIDCRCMEHGCGQVSPIIMRLI